MDSIWKHVKFDNFSRLVYGYTVSLSTHSSASGDMTKKNDHDYKFYRHGNVNNSTH